jgi:nucleoside-diphosphate-sugar epimerase
MTTTTRPVALVTGASTGIGKAAALALAAAGFETVGTSRKTSGADRRDGVTFLALDVGSDDSVAAAVEQVIGRFGRIDEEGDDPAIVAKAIVAAATDSKPKVRYTAGRQARLVSAARRILPAGVFDGQIRKSNKLVG